MGVGKGGEISMFVACIRCLLRVGELIRVDSILDKVIRSINTYICFIRTCSRSDAFWAAVVLPAHLSSDMSVTQS